MPKRSNREYPKIRKSDVGTSKAPLNKSKIAIITGTSLVAVTIAVGAFALSKPDNIVPPSEQVPSDYANEVSWEDGWGGAEDSFTEVNFEEPVYNGTGEEATDGTNPDGTVNQLWYSLTENEKNTATKSNPIMSTGATNAVFSRVVGQINKQYSEKLAKQQEMAMGAQNSAVVESDFNKPVDIGWGTGGNGDNNNSNNNGNSVVSAPTNNTNTANNSPTQSPPTNDTDTANHTDKEPVLSDSLMLWLASDKNSINDLDLEGMTVIEGSSLQEKMFDALNNFTNEIVIDTANKFSEDDIVAWITKDYSNKLMVAKVDYGFLEESERYFYISVKYNTTKSQMNEMVKFAQKNTKELSSLTEPQKITKVGKVISDLGSYSKEGKKDIFSPYTLFKHGYGVCQAYTTLGKIMLDEVGIKNGIATGVMDGESHSWNVVEINGKVVHVDFTVYDTTSNPKYLSIGSDTISQDRKISNIIW